MQNIQLHPAARLDNQGNNALCAGCRRRSVVTSGPLPQYTTRTYDEQYVYVIVMMKMGRLLIRFDPPVPAPVCHDP
jgi:hypothetical protein